MIMKYILPFAICFLLFTGSMISAGQTTARPERQVVTDIHRLQNGKYSCSVRNHEGSPARFFNPGMTKSDKENPLSPNTDRSVPTHHIVFHFDRQDCWNFLLCVGTDTVFSDMNNMTWLNNVTLEADMTDGYYELVSNMWGLANDNYFVVKHRFHVYKDMDTTLLSTSAKNDLNLLAVDENGNPLTGVTGAGGDGFGINIEFQDEWHASFFSMCFTGTLPDILKITDVPPEMKLVLNRVFVTENGNYHQYMISYPAIAGLFQDTTLINSSSGLKSFPHYLTASPAGNDYFLAWGYGSVENDSLTGLVDPFVGAFLDDHYPGHQKDTVMLYVNQSAADTNKSFFGSFIDHLEGNPMTSPALTDLLTSVTYLYKDDPLVLSTEGAYPPVDGDYRIQPGGVVSAGSTAPFNVAWQYTLPGQSVIDLYTHFRGMSNERRYIDVSKATYQIWDANGLLAQDSMRNNFRIHYYTPGPALYEVLINDSNYTLFGKQGFLQTALDFDLSNPVDANSPTMIAFKVLQGDVVSPEIVRGFPASVRFTAADYEFPYQSHKRVYHSLSGVLLSYKRYEETAWTSLAVIPDPAGFDSLSGMPYTADLSPVMSSYADSALVDLQVVLIDSAGNSTRQTLHPAFLLRDVITQIPPVLSDIGLRISPNPTRGILTLEVDDLSGPAWITISGITGKELWSRAVCAKSTEIDLSALPSGVYILRLTDDKGIRSARVIRL
jgi:hypothetical protein